MVSNEEEEKVCHGFVDGLCVGSRGKSHYVLRVCHTRDSDMDDDEDVQMESAFPTFDSKGKGKAVEQRYDEDNLPWCVCLSHKFFLLETFEQGRKIPTGDLG